MVTISSRSQIDLARFLCQDEDQKVILPWQAVEMVRASDFAPRVMSFRPMIGNNGFYFNVANESFLLVTFDGDLRPCQASDL